MKNSQQSQSPQSIAPNSGIMNVYEELLFHYPDVIPQNIKDNFANEIKNNSADKINIELPGLDSKTNYTFTQIDGMYFLGKSFVNEGGKKQFQGLTKVSNTDLVFEGSYFDSDKVQEKKFIGKFINATDPSFDVINQGSKISLVSLHPQHLKQALTDKKLPKANLSTYKTTESKVVGERDNFLRKLVEEESKSKISAVANNEKKPSIFTSIGKKFNQFFKGAYSSHTSQPEIKSGSDSPSTSTQKPVQAFTAQDQAVTEINPNLGIDLSKIKSDSDSPSTSTQKPVQAFTAQDQAVTKTPRSQDRPPIGKLDPLKFSVFGEMLVRSRRNGKESDGRF